jgi:hypothetical protein
LRTCLTATCPPTATSVPQLPTSHLSALRSGFGVSCLSGANAALQPSPAHSLIGRHLTHFACVNVCCRMKNVLMLHPGRPACSLNCFGTQSPALSGMSTWASRGCASAKQRTWAICRPRAPGQGALLTVHAGSLTRPFPSRAYVAALWKDFGIPEFVFLSQTVASPLRVIAMWRVCLQTTSDPLLLSRPRRAFFVSARSGLDASRYETFY